MPKGPGPEPGQDTEARLLEIGYTWEQIEDLKPEGDSKGHSPQTLNLSRMSRWESHVCLIEIRPSKVGRLPSLRSCSANL